VSAASDQQKLRTAFALHEAGRLHEAALIYREIIEQDADNCGALHFLGVIEAARGDFARAKSLIARSLSIQPKNIPFIENYALILFRMGEFGTALHASQQGLQLNGASVSLLYVAAISLFKLHRFEESIAQFDRILLRQPNHIAALTERGAVLAALKKYDGALDSIERALSLDPRCAEAHLIKGNVCGELQRHDEALTAYKTALALKPDLTNAWLGRGNLLRAMRRFDEALASYDKALNFNPNLAEAWLGRGNVFRDTARHDDAFAAYDKALALNPNLAQAWLGRGNVLRDIKRSYEASAAYDKALKLNPRLAEAWLGRASAACDLNLVDDAMGDFQKVLETRPDYSEARFALCFAELPILYADEEEIVRRRAAYEQKLHALSGGVASGDVKGDLLKGLGFMQPFFLAYQGYNDIDLQRLYGSLASRIVEQRYPSAPLSPPPARDEAIRIGIVSNFFYSHTVWKILIKGWISQLNRTRFRVFGYHTGTSHDAETEIAAKICDRFVARALNVDGWREEILSDAPHVLIYPGLLMDNVSVLLAAQRLAPVQCNSWGHPETSGLPTLDYFLSSDLMEPPDAASHYTERLIRLPNLSIYYEPIATEVVSVSRADYGLRSDATVF